VGLLVVASVDSSVDLRVGSNVVSSVDSRGVSSACAIADEGDVTDSKVPAAVAAASLVAVAEQPGMNNRSTRSTSMDLLHIILFNDDFACHCGMYSTYIVKGALRVKLEFKGLAFGHTRRSETGKLEIMCNCIIIGPDYGCPGLDRQSCRNESE